MMLYPIAAWVLARAPRSASKDMRPVKEIEKGTRVGIWTADLDPYWVRS